MRLRLVAPATMLLPLLLSSPFSVQAQVALGMSPPSGPASAAETSVDSLRERMRQLMIAQEGYYSDRGTYTTDLVALGLATKRLKGDPNWWWIRVWHAGGAGWTADAQGAGVFAGSCVAYVGRLVDFPSVPTTKARELKPTGDGEITCDP